MAINLNNVLSPFRSIDIGSFYLNYASFIDAIVYFILFLSLAQFVFMKLYKNEAHKENPFKESKMIAVAIGLVLTISMVVLEMQTGFNLGQLWSVALIIFLIVLAMLLYNLLQGLFTGKEGKTQSAALTYLIIYGLLVVPFNALNTWINTNAGFLSAVLTLAALVAFIYLLIELFKMVGLGGKDDKDANKGGDLGDPKKGEKKEEDIKKPEEEKKPETDPEDKPLDSNISTIETFLRENIKPTAKAYSEMGLSLIELHRGKVSGKKDSAENWANFYNAEDALLKDIKAFNDFNNKLFNNPHYKELTKKDLEALNGVMKEFNDLNAKILTFRTEMVKAYNDNAAPEPKTVG